MLKAGGFYSPDSQAHRPLVLAHRGASDRAPENTLAAFRAAIAAGADGLLLEVHHDPEHALSDGAQSITPGGLVEVIQAVRRIAEAVGREG